MVFKVPPCFPHFLPQGEGSQDQICATLLIKMKVFNAYEASPTGGKWGKKGEEVYNDLVLSFDEFELLRVTAGHCRQTLKTNSRGLPPLGESGGRMRKDSRHGS